MRLPGQTDLRAGPFLHLSEKMTLRDPLLVTRRHMLKSEAEGGEALCRNTRPGTSEPGGDTACIMTSKEKLKKVRTVLLATAIPFCIMEWTSIFLWIFQGIWWPFAVYTMLAVPYIIWIFHYHWKNVSYICPRCHAVFRPGRKEAFFARHTPTTRRLTCTHCGYRGFCAEICCEEGSVHETIS